MAIDEPAMLSEKGGVLVNEGVSSLVPIPDPTALTTAVLQREVRHLREVLDGKLDGRKEFFEQRFNDMDKAIEVLESARVALRANTSAEVDRAVKASRDVIDARLTAVSELSGHRFDALERAMVSGLADLAHQLVGSVEALVSKISDQDRRFEQSKLDSKAAIDAALQAAKEAVGKTEVVTDKQINEVKGLMSANAKSQDDKLEALKDRFNDERQRTDAVAAAAATSYAGSQGTVIGERAAQTRFYATIGLIFTVVLGVMAVVTFAILRAA